MLTKNTGLACFFDWFGWLAGWFELRDWFDWNCLVSSICLACGYQYIKKTKENRGTTYL